MKQAIRVNDKVIFTENKSRIKGVVINIEDNSIHTIVDQVGEIYHIPKYRLDHQYD